MNNENGNTLCPISAYLFEWNSIPHSQSFLMHHTFTVFPDIKIIISMYISAVKQAREGINFLILWNVASFIFSAPPEKTSPWTFLLRDVRQTRERMSVILDVQPSLFMSSYSSSHWLYWNQMFPSRRYDLHSSTCWCRNAPIADISKVQVCGPLTFKL